MNDVSGFSMEFFVHHKPCTAPKENFVLPRGSFAAETNSGKQQTCRRKIVREGKRQNRKDQIVIMRACRRSGNRTSLLVIIDRHLIVHCFIHHCACLRRIGNSPRGIAHTSQFVLVLGGLEDVVTKLVFGRLKRGNAEILRQRKKLSGSPFGIGQVHQHKKS